MHDAVPLDGVPLADEHRISPGLQEPGQLSSVVADVLGLRVLELAQDGAGRRGGLPVVAANHEQIEALGVHLQEIDCVDVMVSEIRVETDGFDLCQRHMRVVESDEAADSGALWRREELQTFAVDLSDCSRVEADVRPLVEALPKAHAVARIGLERVHLPVGIGKQDADRADVCSYVDHDTGLEPRVGKNTADEFGFLESDLEVSGHVGYAAPEPDSGPLGEMRATIGEIPHQSKSES